jgi:hypothetical protein
MIIISIRIIILIIILIILIIKGTIVSLSSDGNTLASSGIFDNSTNGATWIYSRDSSSGNFFQNGTKLVGIPFNVNASQQGISIHFYEHGIF